MKMTEKFDRKKGLKCTAHNERFGVMAAVARRKFCGYLEVYRPPEPLWNPRLREAATTLCVMRGQRSGNGQADNDIEENQSNIKQ